MRQLRQQERQFGKQVGDIPSIHQAGFVQNILNPFPLASTGLLHSAVGVSGPIRILGFYCTTVVTGTNNATNYWKIELKQVNNNSIMATILTTSESLGVWTKHYVVPSAQPNGSEAGFWICPTAVLSPGPIHILPGMMYLRL
jgi:hypothetical protein